MKIEIEKIKQLKEDAGQIFLEPEGEEVLLQFLEIKKQVEEAEKAIKATLEETALKISDEFKSIQGDNIKVYYRFFGSRYTLEPGLEDQVPKELVEEKIKYSLKTKELEEYIEQKNGIPYGVRETDRQKQITFKLKGEVENDAN